MRYINELLLPIHPKFKEFDWSLLVAKNIVTRTKSQFKHHVSTQLHMALKGWSYAFYRFLQRTKISRKLQTTEAELNDNKIPTRISSIADQDQASQYLWNFQLKYENACFPPRASSHEDPLLKLSG